ncbi:fimbrial adhesin FimH (plasmid) [Serratia marcescens]|nr:fimbrial adhesin FimH [Serratia marcescens]
MKIRNGYLLMIFFSLSFDAFSYTGACHSVGGTIAFTFKMEPYSESIIENNRAEYVVVNGKHFNISTKYLGKCDIPKDMETPIYFTGVSSLPFYKSSEVGDWYKLNEYLAVSSKILVKNNGMVQVPFSSISNKIMEENGGLTSWYSGGQGELSIMIIRPFIGRVNFNSEIVKVYGSAINSKIQPKEPMTKLFVSGAIVVPQKCMLNAGEVINVSFGNISTGSFKSVGKKADGVRPQVREVNIKCNNIDAQTKLTLRLQADSASGNAIVSDNKDVGFVVADIGNKELTPNILSSFIPFALDDGARARVPFKVWPISVTGRRPAEGVVTAKAYLRVDFD